MAKLPIYTKTVFVSSSYGNDIEVGLNTNSDPSDKVQAFVDCFVDAAQKTSRGCAGLPVKFILAHWGAESGWGANRAVQSNQNWGCIRSVSLPITRGRGSNGYCIFYGKNTFRDGYVHIMNNVSNYKDMMSYLRSSSNPSVDACIELLAQSGYSETGSSAYSGLLRDCVGSINKRTDFNAKYPS